MVWRPGTRRRSRQVRERGHFRAEGTSRRAGLKGHGPCMCGWEGAESQGEAGGGAGSAMGSHAGRAPGAGPRGPREAPPRLRVEGGLCRILLPDLEQTPRDDPGCRAIALCCLPHTCPGPGLLGFMGRSVPNASRGPSGHHGARPVAGATGKPAEQSPCLSLVAPGLPGPAYWLVSSGRPAPRDVLDSRPSLQEADVGLSSLRALAPAGESAPPAIRTGWRVPPTWETRSRALPGARPAPASPQAEQARHQVKGQGQGRAYVAEGALHGAWGGGQHLLLLRKSCPTSAREHVLHRQTRSSERFIQEVQADQEPTGGPPRSSPPPTAKTLHPAPLLHGALKAPSPRPPRSWAGAPAASVRAWASSGRRFPSALCAQHHHNCVYSQHL